MLNNIVHKTAHVVRIVVNLDVCWFIRDHQLKVMTKTSSTGSRGKNPFRTPRPMIDVGVVSLLFLIISIAQRVLRGVLIRYTTLLLAVV